MLTLAALLPAALFGGGRSGSCSWTWSRRGSWKAAGWVGGGGALLVVMIPVGIVFLPYILRFSPLAAALPLRGAGRVGATARPGPRRTSAPGLPRELRRCIGDQAVPPSGEALLAMGCDAAPRRSLALGPEQLMKLGSYSDNDDGWRWQVTDSAGQRRVIVLPDPLYPWRSPGPRSRCGGEEKEPCGTTRRRPRDRGVSTGIPRSCGLPIFGNEPKLGRGAGVRRANGPGWLSRSAPARNP